MPLGRSDVLETYRILLGREPEDEQIIETHLANAQEPITLVQNIARSREARERLNMTAEQAPHEHQVYKGYSAADLSVFELFTPSKSHGLRGFITNFLGCRYRTTFSTSLHPHDGDVEGYPVPVGSYQGETAEFIGALRSVTDAKKERYRMLECGAGFGTWMAITHAAARQRGIADIHVYGIEGDSGHFAFLEQHMKDNEIANFTALQGAVGSVAGTAKWPIAENPSDVYGGRPLSGASDYRGLQPRTVDVQVYALAEVLEREHFWNLVHMDIQGGEGELCRDCIGSLTGRVGRVVVGTHSRRLDGEIMTTFYSAGWSLENEKPTIAHWQDMAPSLEMLTAVDGIQVWRNPFL